MSKCSKCGSDKLLSSTSMTFYCPKCDVKQEDELSDVPCDSCKVYEDYLYQTPDDRLLCATCFMHEFYKEMKENIKKNKVFIFHREEVACKCRICGSYLDGRYIENKLVTYCPVCTKGEPMEGQGDPYHRHHPRDDIHIENCKVEDSKPYLIRGETVDKKNKTDKWGGLLDLGIEAKGLARSVLNRSMDIQERLVGSRPSSSDEMPKSDPNESVFNHLTYIFNEIVHNLQDTVEILNTIDN